MSYMVEIVDRKTREPVKTLGPMSEGKANRIERGLLRNIDDENYFVQTVEVTNDLDNMTTQPMDMDE